MAHSPRPVLLDGGLATELQRTGESVRAPWWTNKALLVGAKRDRLRRIHEDYVAAGAEVLTANTFRCNLRTLGELGFDPSAGMAWMVHAAVGVASAAAGSGDAIRVAGSIAPVADCYRPDLVPDDAELRIGHRWLATELVRCGVDFVLVETMNTVREARIAVEEVVAVGGVPWVSFVCGDDALLLSGEPLVEAARAAEAAGAELISVNCTSLARTEVALRVLRAATDGAIGAYPNIEDRSPDESGHLDRFVEPASSPEEFAAELASWHEEFALDLLGGCCGTSPAHLAALRTALADRTAQEQQATAR